MRLLRAVTMVVELVNFMASTNKFWFIVILHVSKQIKSKCLHNAHTSDKSHYFFVEIQLVGSIS